MAVYLIFYRLFLLLYAAGIRIAALQNKKAKLWLAGRKNWQQTLRQQINEKIDTRLPVVWMHCASLGEFEQGRPVLEQLKQATPETQFIVSFFSPSGYEVRNNYAGAGVVCYLPPDGPFNAKAFLQIVQPTLVLWVKYEYWYYYLSEIKSRQIPLLLVSGIFRPGQPFFRWYGGLHRAMVNYFTRLFLQNEASEQLAATITHPDKIQLTGDTRFDRVIEIAENFKPISAIEKWLAGADRVMVCGSTWDEDDKELSHYVHRHPEIRFILAPHNVNTEEIADLLQLFPGSNLYSQFGKSNTPENHVLIIDTVGILSRLYNYATVAYVGGGFGGEGVHNVLEAAVYGRPVVHGPEYEKFAEAKDLIEAGGAFETTDALHLEKLLDQLFTDTAFAEKAAATAQDYVYAHKGATEAIISYIQANRLLIRL